MTRKPLRVVIIDDSPDDRAEIRQLLLSGSERPYSFIEAETGKAGIDAVLHAEADPPDCVFLDFNLPDTDALGVLRALSMDSGEPLCPIVVLTGSVMAVTAERLLASGAQDYLDKSWLNAGILMRAFDNAGTRFKLARQAHDSESPTTTITK